MKEPEQLRKLLVNKSLAPIPGLGVQVRAHRQGRAGIPLACLDPMLSYIIGQHNRTHSTGQTTLGVGAKGPALLHQPSVEEVSHCPAPFLSLCRQPLTRLPPSVASTWLPWPQVGGNARGCKALRTPPPWPFPCHGHARKQGSLKGLAVLPCTGQAINILLPPCLAALASCSQTARCPSASVWSCWATSSASTTLCRWA